MTKPYKHKLAKKDWKHLRKYDITCKALIVAHMKRLAKERKTSKLEPCWECKDIARKLGLSL